MMEESDSTAASSQPANGCDGGPSSLANMDENNRLSGEDDGVDSFPSRQSDRNQQQRDDEKLQKHIIQQ